MPKRSVSSLLQDADAPPSSSSLKYVIGIIVFVCVVGGAIAGILAFFGVFSGGGGDDDDTCGPDGTFMAYNFPPSENHAAKCFNPQPGKVTNKKGTLGCCSCKANTQGYPKNQGKTCQLPLDKAGCETYFNDTQRQRFKGAQDGFCTCASKYANGYDNSGSVIPGCGQSVTFNCNATTAKPMVKPPTGKVPHNEDSNLWQKCDCTTTNATFMTEGPNRGKCVCRGDIANKCLRIQKGIKFRLPGTAMVRTESIATKQALDDNCACTGMIAGIDGSLVGPLSIITTESQKQEQAVICTNSSADNPNIKGVGKKSSGVLGCECKDTSFKPGCPFKPIVGCPNRPSKPPRSLRDTAWVQYCNGCPRGEKCRPKDGCSGTTGPNRCFCCDGCQYTDQAERCFPIVPSQR